MHSAMSPVGWVPVSETALCWQWLSAGTSCQLAVAEPCRWCRVLSSFFLHVKTFFQQSKLLNAVLSVCLSVCLSVTLLIHPSFVVCTCTHLYSLRDFWRHFSLCRAAAHSDCCFFVAVYKYSYLLTPTRCKV